MATRWEMPLRLNSSVTSSGMEARSPRRMPRARADSGSGRERARASLSGRGAGGRGEGAAAPPRQILAVVEAVDAGRSREAAREGQLIAGAIGREEARRDQNLA